MSAGWVVGGGLGLIAASGVMLAVRSAPPMRPIRLADRMAPYLGDAPPPSKLLERPSATSAPFAVARRIFGPVLGELVGLIDRVVGGSASVRRRLNGLGAATTVEEFRVEQVLWGASGGAVVALLVVAGGLLYGQVPPALAVLAALGGVVAGVLGRDYWLTHQLEQREEAMLSEFPVVADLLALAVVAGESPVDALDRVCRLVGGELARDLGRALDRARSGRPITAALGELAEQTTMESFSRFLQGLVVAIERGTPLADVLRAQAVDVREVGKRALLEAGGRKEISMMIPVKNRRTYYNCSLPCALTPRRAVTFSAALRFAATPARARCSSSRSSCLATAPRTGTKSRAHRVVQDRSFGYSATSVVRRTVPSFTSLLPQTVLNKSCNALKSFPAARS